MNNFEFHNPTRIVFGKNTEERVGELSKKYGKKVLLHYGGGSIKKYGLYDTVIKSLKSNDIEYVELGGVVPNPVLSKVYEGIELCKRENIDFILAVGGGSVIDSAKAISAGVKYDGDVWDFFEAKAFPEKALPIGVVLTIPAAGSESSTGSVITKEEGLLKRSFGGEIMIPKFAIMNPELTYTLPNYQTACGAIDMFGHVIERYFTQVENVELSDRFCESVMHTVINNAGKALLNNKDYNARAEIMWAGTLAHNNLVGLGRDSDWASHIIEHELSAMYNITHGAGLAIIYPAWMKYVYKENIDRFVLFANKVFGIEINVFNKEETALKGIKALEDFYTSVGIPFKLGEVGITEEHFEEMASKATNDGSFEMGAFKKLNKNDVVNIFKLAL